MKKNPYEACMQWVRENPEAGSSTCIARVLASLYNDQAHKYSIAEISICDRERKQLALDAVVHYLQHGETSELLNAAQELLRLLPELAQESKTQQLRELGEVARRMNPAEQESELLTVYNMIADFAEQLGVDVEISNDVKSAEVTIHRPMRISDAVDGLINSMRNQLAENRRPRARRARGRTEPTSN